MRRTIPPGPFLYPIVDVGVVGEAGVVGGVAQLAAAGVRLLQLRAKTLSDHALVSLAKEALAAAHAHGALLVINDRPDIARIVAADGVHVGQGDLPPQETRQVVGPNVLVGVSTHNLEQLQKAAREKVDYVALGPIFPTTGKEYPDPAVGLALLRKARESVSLPLVAIGGVTRVNAASVFECGVDGVAVIGDLFRAEGVAEALAGFQAVLPP